MMMMVGALSPFSPSLSGRILLDGCDLRHVSVRSLRRAIGYVPQETVSRICGQQ